MGPKKVFFNLLVIILFFSACRTIDLYEQNTRYPDHQWDSKKINIYEFNITDTQSNYNIFFVIRHHNAYHYKNIWLQIDTQSPDDSLSTKAINLNLADDQKGWLGSGMDDIFDQRIPIYASPVKLKMGKYQFKLKHTMREDPLQNILSTGIRVEKAPL